MQLRQRVQILERWSRARRRVPLVVPFGVDADEQCVHRSRAIRIFRAVPWLCRRDPAVIGPDPNRRA